MLSGLTTKNVIWLYLSLLYQGHGYHNEKNPIDEFSYNAGNSVKSSEYLLHNPFRCPPIYNTIPQTKNPAIERGFLFVIYIYEIRLKIVSHIHIYSIEFNAIVFSETKIISHM